MADPSEPPTRSADILLFRRVGRESLPASGEPQRPIGAAPVSTGTRFVYDVAHVRQAYVVSYKGAVIRKHATLDLALENARLIASNFWVGHGIPTLVRHVHDDGAIQPVVAFG